MDWQDLYDLEV
jgi:hypothetical protein